MATYKLGELDKWIKKAKARARAAARMAVENTANEANTSRNSGGRLPWDTGFLFRSMGGHIGSMPTGDTMGVKGVEYAEVNDSVSAAAARWDPFSGKAFYVGWTAAYARPMEYRYGFMRGAAENWDMQVERAAKTAKQRIK